MTYAHDAHCNVIHTPGPEDCPPHCYDPGHVRREGACPSCGSEVRLRTGGLTPPIPILIDPTIIRAYERRSFTVRTGTPFWRRKVVDMHTTIGDPVQGRRQAEVVARYWSRRRAAGLARVLNVMQRNGGRL